MDIKEQIIISLGKKMWGITPIDCEYMGSLLRELTEGEAKEVYKKVVNAQHINLNTFSKACREVKGQAILQHEVEANTLLEKLHKIVEKISWERKINNFIQGRYPLEKILINNKPTFTKKELAVLRMAHKTYKDLVQYREYERVRDNMRYISIKFWILGLTDGNKALKH